MITPAYVQMMAQYNLWQNESLYAAADGLTEKQRQLDRGAFFGSIHDTLSHILWGDTLWMGHFDGAAKPTSTAQEWSALKTGRLVADKRIIDWASRIEPDELTGDLAWYSGVLKQDIVKPRGMCITHSFNHQTHHRGQVHGMLTAAGAKPDDTDIIFMPDYLGENNV